MWLDVSNQSSSNSPWFRKVWTFVCLLFHVKLIFLPRLSTFHILKLHFVSKNFLMPIKSQNQLFSASVFKCQFVLPNSIQFIYCNSKLQYLTFLYWRKTVETSPAVWLLESWLLPPAVLRRGGGSRACAVVWRRCLCLIAWVPDWCSACARYNGGQSCGHPDSADIGEFPHSNSRPGTRTEGVIDWKVNNNKVKTDLAFFFSWPVLCWIS